MLLIVDESEHFQISHEPPANSSSSSSPGPACASPAPALKFLARHSSAKSHLVVLCGLKNNVYRPGDGRVGVLVQWMYAKLFAELVSFRVAFDGRSIVPCAADGKEDDLAAEECAAVPLQLSARSSRHP